MSVLETREVTIQRSDRSILRDVSVRLEAGQLLGIVGPNGSGKSSLLRTLAGLWSPSAGTVLLDGRALSSWHRRDLARRISFVPQDTHVDFAFTVDELVAMGRYPHRGRFSRESTTDKAAIRAALEQCDVSSLAQRHADTLSGGELQRVLIARSLAVEPDFILLDEPTSSLDVEHSLDILEICAKLCRQGKAVAVSTHDLNAIARYASSIVLLQHGALIDQGPVESVLNPASIARVFGVSAEVLPSQDGTPYYVFHKRDSRASTF